MDQIARTIALPAVLTYAPSPLHEPPFLSRYDVSALELTALDKALVLVILVLTLVLCSLTASRLAKALRRTCETDKQVRPCRWISRSTCVSVPVGLGVYYVRACALTFIVR